jgi:pimeloyl-ACP methyl ester carboxylesterase
VSLLSISPSDIRNAVANVRNNTWRVYRDTGSVIVFVHGVMSNSQACWYNAKAGKFWPDMVAEDDTFRDSGVYLGGYYTAYDSTNFGIADCAQWLLSSLHAATDHPAVLDHARIIFVCHSLGGIVTRYMLERWREAFKKKKIGLLLMASPSIGSVYANTAESLLRLLQHEAGRQLEWKSPELVDIDRRFRDLLQQRLIPDLWGREACEHRCPVYHRYLGVILNHFPPVVSVDSAARYFGDGRLLPGTTHSSCVKPDSTEHCSHLLLREFYGEVSQRFPIGRWTPPASFLRASDPMGKALEASHIFRSKRIGFEAVINDDGDAINETWVDGITDLRSNSETSWELEAWTESGHTSQYVTVRHRTPLHVRLVEEDSGPTLIRQKVVLDVAPSVASPAAVALQSIDFNAWAMDANELRLRQDARQDNTDYLQKSIRWDDTEELIVSVRFSEGMRLTGAVSVEGYQLIHGDERDIEVYDETLTAEAEPCLDYSELMRTATLRIPHPAKWTAYRIVWQLDDSDRAASSEEMAVVQEYRTRLLSIRDLFAAGVPGSAQRTKVTTAMADLGKLVIAEIRRRAAQFNKQVTIRFDATQLELSLMAVDAPGTSQREVLRIVAGTFISDESWNKPIAMGDGIAGRAAKRLEPRVYDGLTGDKLRDAAYLPLLKTRRHAWLLSIPLWEPACGRHAYGVINIGTFDQAHAGRMRVLDNSESIKTLLDEATGPFLRRLIDATADAPGSDVP